MKIEFKKITRRTGGRVILSEVSATFAPGSVNVIIGPNGAGKTTLMRVAALLAPPDSGEILLDNTPVQNLPTRQKTEWRRRMGFVFQTPLLLEGSVLQNLLSGLLLRHIPPDPQNARRLLEQVGLAGRENQPAKKLSGGEKQRLQLARMLILQPEICFLDEPAANLDPLSAKAIEEVIAGLPLAGKTVILTTHNLIQARSLGRRFFFMKEGRMIHEGDGSGFFHQPACLDIAEFAAADNIIYGETVHEKGGVWLQTNGPRILVAAPHITGKAAAVIRAEDIILSSHRLDSSARNCFPGTVVSIGDMGVILSITVSCSGQKFLSVITRESAQLLHPQINHPIWVCFKSTAVHLLNV